MTIGHLRTGLMQVDTGDFLPGGAHIKWPGGPGLAPGPWVWHPCSQLLFSLFIVLLDLVLSSTSFIYLFIMICVELILIFSVLDWILTENCKSEIRWWFLTDCCLSASFLTRFYTRVLDVIVDWFLTVCLTVFETVLNPPWFLADSWLFPPICSWLVSWPGFWLVPDPVLDWSFNTCPVWPNVKKPSRIGREPQPLVVVLLTLPGLFLDFILCLFLTWLVSSWRTACFVLFFSSTGWSISSNNIQIFLNSFFDSAAIHNTAFRKRHRPK